MVTVGEHRGHGRIERRINSGTIRGLQHALQHSPETCYEARFPFKRLDDFDAAQRFLQVGIHLAHCSAGSTLRLANAYLEESSDDD